MPHIADRPWETMKKATAKQAEKNHAEQGHQAHYKVVLGKEIESYKDCPANSCKRFQELVG